jgi:hypothetical protein
MTPIRANIVGPSWSGTSTSASIAGLPFFGIVLYLRKVGDVERGVNVLAGWHDPTKGEQVRSKPR